MKRVRWLATMVAIGPLIGQALAEGTRIGEIVPKVEFKDIRYLRRTLTDLGEHEGFALVFLNAECPVSRRFAPKLRALDARYADKGIQFVGVFCSARDTLMEMASFALDQDLRFRCGDYPRSTRFRARRRSWVCLPTCICVAAT